jgi:hypothetical protein
LIAVSVTTATATPQNAAQGLSPTEEWVVAQVTAGEIADLSEKFPEEHDRKLRAHFLEDLLTGTLPNVKLHRRGVRIQGAIIDEPFDLRNAQIPCELWLNHCQFMSDVSCIYTSLAGGVSFAESRFKAEANFNSMKVGRTASFNKAVFEGPVNFVAAEIASAFVANEAQFQNKENGAMFSSIKVGQVASFDKATFEGPVSFVGAEIASGFSANEAQFQNKEMNAKFSGAKVQGHVSFKDALFEGPVDFRYADLNTLDVSGASWPKKPSQFDMQGMSYKYVRAVPRNEPESHKALLKLADHSAYTADVYGNLEEFFKRQGYRADADRAFIAGKCRERKEYFHSGDWGRWLGSWILYLLVGYGRHPERSGYVGLGIVVLGCILFPLKKMELHDPKELEKPKEKRRQYNRFWYSLGLFLPVVDLKTSELWGPKPQYRFLRHYVRVHILLGWILIPLVLAALTGLIK